MICVLIEVIDGTAEYSRRGSPFTESHLLWLGIFVRREYLSFLSKIFGSPQFSQKKNKTILF